MIEMSALSLPDAQQVLINAVTSVGTEIIDTVDALGCVLAEEIVTAHAFPDTQRSAVDGFAVNQQGLKEYRIVATLGAGELPQHQLKEGQAAAVMTGATVPEGSVAVIRVEDTIVTDDLLALKADISVGENINRVGEEMAKEANILCTGTRLTPVKHSALCCAGTARVKVHQLPTVGILITGDEVLQLGENHRTGSVYDSNRHFLTGCLAQLGIQCKVLGPVNDDETTISESLDQLAKECDLVISSGGVSMGKYDFIRPLLHSRGFDVLVNRTGIKPGRPLIVARRDATMFFGMPGYPAACLVNFFYYLLPTIKRLMGIGDVLPVVRPVLLATPLKGRKGRWDVIRVKLDREAGQERAHKLTSQLTSHFLNFGRCDGLVLLGDEVDRRNADERVDLLEFLSQF